MKSVTGLIDLMEDFCKGCDQLEIKKEDGGSKVTLLCKAKEFESCYNSYTGDGTLSFWR